jgi:small subunit ribosomal protein S3
LRIESKSGNIIIYLYISDINLVAGTNQENLSKITKEINSLISDKKDNNLRFNLIEVKNFYSSAQNIANSVATQIKNRTPFRMVLRNTISKLINEKTLEGVNIKVSGRLDGAEIARSERVSHGKMPLSTIDSNIEYAHQEVTTTYGKIGIKVLAYKGKIWRRKNPKKNNF